MLLLKLLLPLFLLYTAKLNISQLPIAMTIETTILAILVGTNNCKIPFIYSSPGSGLLDDKGVEGSSCRHFFSFQAIGWQIPRAAAAEDHDHVFRWQRLCQKCVEEIRFIVEQPCNGLHWASTLVMGARWKGTILTTKGFLSKSLAFRDKISCLIQFDHSRFHILVWPYLTDKINILFHQEFSDENYFVFASHKCCIWFTWFHYLNTIAEL